jgi:hypothetical protein
MAPCFVMVKPVDCSVINMIKRFILIYGMVFMYGRELITTCY